MRLHISFAVLAVLALVLAAPALAQDEYERTFAPIGGHYTDTFPGFVEAALKNLPADAERFYILILPITYGYTWETLSTADLLDNSFFIDTRRNQLEQACAEVAPEGVPCEVNVAPIYARDAALEPLALEYFTDDLTAVYIPGGDQQLGMRVIANTPVEEALRAAYERGVVIGGNSAGLAVQARTMIAGYTDEDAFSESNALNEDAVWLWRSATFRGLDFGVRGALLDQHFYAYSRPGRLLNAIAQPNVPHIGIGVDDFTGALIHDETVIGDVFGLYTVTIYDAETFGAAAGATYKDGVLSMRDVLVHMIAPGGAAYDLATRQTSFAALPESVTTYQHNATVVPAGAGTIILSGGLAAALGAGGDAPNAIIERFIDVSGGDDAALAVIVAGYPSAAAATLAGGLWADALGGDVDVIVGEPGETLPDLSGYTGVLFAAPDASLLDISQYGALRSAWSGGLNILADGAAAATLGAGYMPYGPTLEEESATQGSFIKGAVEPVQGFGFVPARFETRVMSDIRWGYWTAQAFQSEQISYAINEGAALEVNADGATVLGTNAVIALDLRGALVDEGSNGAMMFANGVLDVFAPGDVLE